mmetsp:Transcript_9612/g.30283  ORF Transcript_9612/g.30283 Transcript_9612/m.30283 type:complete len:680 (-) Transcript_9612:60-2099(-)
MSSAKQEANQLVSLREAAQSYFVQRVFSVAKGHPFVLVADTTTLPLVSDTFTLYDAMEHGCALVEALANPREKMEGIHAIYLFAPNERAVNLILQDFRVEEGRVVPKTCCEKIMYYGLKPASVTVALYDHVHLVFTRAMPPALEAKIRANEMLADRIRSWTEIDMMVRSFEQSAFTLNLPRSALSLYGNHPGADKAIELIARKLVHVCVLLKEYPYIRYRADSWVQPVARRLQALLDEYVAAKSDFHFRSPRGTIMLVDRKIDALVPLMHEYTYQAAVADLLDVKDGKYEYEAKSDAGGATRRTIVLNESNDMWVQFRHSTISSVIAKVNELVRELEEERKDLTGDKDFLSRTGGAQEKIQALNDFRQTQSANAQQTALLSAVQRQINERDLLQLMVLEHELATGVDIQGKTVDFKAIKPRVLEYLDNPKPSVQDKARLVLLYLSAAPDADDEVRRHFSTLDGVSNDIKNALVNIKFVGVTHQKPAAGAPGASRPGLTPAKAAARALEDVRRANEGAVERPHHRISRYRPVVEDVLEAHLEGTLSDEEYPYVVAPPPMARPTPTPTAEETKVGRSVRKRKLGLRDGPPGAGAGAGAGEEKEETPKAEAPRLILFVGGCASYSELRSAYEVSARTAHEVIIGSTAFNTPSEYLALLANLDSSLRATGRGGGVDLDDIVLR